MAEKIHRLKNEAGDIYEVPESELDVAVPALGLQPASDEDVAAYDIKTHYSKPTEKLKAIGYGGLRVGSLGLVDYAFPEYAKELNENLPALSAATEIGGTIAAAIATYGTSLPATFARGGLAGLSMRGAASLGTGAAGLARNLGAGARVQGLARHAVREAAEGAAFGMMQGNKQVVSDGDYERAVSAVLKNAALGGAVGGVFGGALGIGGIGAQAVAGKVGKPLRALGDKFSKANIEAFAETRGFPKGVVQAMGDAAEKGIKAFERRTKIDASAARNVLNSPEILAAAQSQGLKEVQDLVPLLVKNWDNALKSTDDIDKLTRLAGGPGEFTQKELTRALVEIEDAEFRALAKKLSDDQKDFRVTTKKQKEAFEKQIASLEDKVAELSDKVATGSQINLGGLGLRQKSIVDSYLAAIRDLQTTPSGRRLTLDQLQQEQDKIREALAKEIGELNIDWSDVSDDFAELAEKQIELARLRAGYVEDFAFATGKKRRAAANYAARAIEKRNAKLAKEIRNLSEPEANARLQELTKRRQSVIMQSERLLRRETYEEALQPFGSFDEKGIFKPNAKALETGIKKGAWKNLGRAINNATRRRVEVPQKDIDALIRARLKQKYPDQVDANGVTTIRKDAGGTRGEIDPRWEAEAKAIRAGQEGAMTRPIRVQQLIDRGYSEPAAYATVLAEFKKSSVAGAMATAIRQGRGTQGLKRSAAEQLDHTIYQPIRNLLMDENWGEFAKFQKLSNAAHVVRDGANSEAAKFSFKLGKNPNTNFWTKIERADPSAIENFVANIGNGKGEVDSAIMRELAVGWKQSAEAAQSLKQSGIYEGLIPQKAFDNADTLGKAADNILKALDPEDGKSLYSKLYTVSQFQELSKADRRFMGGIPGQLAIGFGIATGSPVVYGGLRTIQAIGDLAQSPVKLVNTIGGIQASVKSLQNSDTSNLKKIFEKTKAIAGTTAKSAAKGAKMAAKGARGVGRSADIGANYSLVNLTANQVLYQENVAELNAELANTEGADESLHDVLNAAAPVPSDLKALAIEKKNIIRDYLANIVMTPAMSNTMLNRPRPPSKTEALRFKQVKEVLDEPSKAAELMANGTLTSEQAKALATVWPSIFADLQAKAMNEMVALAENGKTLPYQRRIQLGVLLQLPTDPTLNYTLIQDVQNSYNTPKVTPQPPQQRRAPKLNRAMMSESQKTEEGVK